MKKVLFLLIIFSLFHFHLFSQSVGINYSGVGANPNALLDADVTGGVSKGMLIPRMTSELRTAMTFTTSAQGLVVYQTDGVQGFYYNTSATTTPSWVFLLSASGSGPSPSATGGVISTSGEWTVHTFTSTATFSVTAGPIFCEYLVVAGGGSGGGTLSGAGGGGAGGLKQGALQISSSQTITVGNGGAGGTGTGNDGGASSIGSLVTTVGGGGGSGAFQIGRTGGSGGGSAFSQSVQGGIGTIDQGNDGSRGFNDGGGFTNGGGGGAGQSFGSVNGIGGSFHPNGGNGLQSAINGTPTYYAGGGGAGRFDTRPGGLGGGGTGRLVTGDAGTANTGGGGGGGGTTGGAGGKGIVIIRYLTNPKSLIADENGKVSNYTASPDAWLKLKPGISTAGGSPLKFTPGDNLTTPEAGAIEYDGRAFYATPRYTNRGIVLVAPTNTLVVGDIFQADSLRTISKLASVSAGSYLRSAGVATKNVWSTLKLPNAATTNFIPYTTSTNTIGESTNLQFNGTALTVATTAGAGINLNANLNAAGYQYTRNTNAGALAHAGYYADNNRGSFASYAGVFVGSSTNTVTAMGTAIADKGVFTTGGASSLGMILGTSTSDPLIIGTNNLERARFLSTGEFLVGATALLGTELAMFRRDQNASTGTFVYNATSGTLARAGTAVINNNGYSVGLNIPSHAFTTSGMLVANTGCVSSDGSAGLNIGTTSNTQLSFWTNNTRRATFIAGGQLILGTATAISGAGELLRLEQNQNSILYQNMSNSTSGTAARTTIGLQTNAGLGLFLGANSTLFTTTGMTTGDASSIASNQTGGLNVGTSSNAQLSFWTNNTKKAQITAGGFFGVGIDPPTVLIHAVRDANDALTRVSVTNNSNGAAAQTLMQCVNNSGFSMLNKVYSSGFTTAGLVVANAGHVFYDGNSQMLIGSTGAAPIIFHTNGSAAINERVRIPAIGGMVVGTAALATTATDGFLYIPTCAGTPTGTPTTQTGTAPMVIDSTNNKLYIYAGGAWVALN